MNIVEKESQLNREILNVDNTILKALIKCLPVGIFIIDSSGKLLEVNSLVYDIWGEFQGIENIQQADKFKGCNSSSGELICGNDWALVRALHGEVSYGEVIDILRFDGEKATILNSASPILDDKNNIIGAVATISDITKIRDLEKELIQHKEILKNLIEMRTNKLININEQLSREITINEELTDKLRQMEQLNLIGQVAAGLGHEIRNPLTTVRGFLQIFQEDSNFQNYHPIFSTMISELDRANSIISEFLSLARVKQVNKAMVNLNEIIYELSPLIQAHAHITSKNLDVILEKNLKELYIDENEIRQLILNLCNNGIEAMGPNKTITLQTYTENNKVILKVKDEGSGMPQKILDNIGKPFLTTKEHGTGLGLATCFSIADKNNAQINIDTNSQGTSIFVCFEE
ncbi:MAG: domain S-box [Bacillales bacterium]|jgi:signal transduction histidine kinase|nr:domain S-box [Bacillales bacterium]